MLLDGSLNLRVSGVKLYAVMSLVSTSFLLSSKEVESFALQQLDCVECKIARCTGCTVLLKDKIVINKR